MNNNAVPAGTALTLKAGDKIRAESGRKIPALGMGDGSSGGGNPPTSDIVPAPLCVVAVLSVVAAVILMKKKQNV